MAERRVGIIGLGFGMQVYVPAFRSEGWTVAAICSRHGDAVAKAAKAHDIEGVYTDALALVAREDLDAVAIATPPAAHHPLALAALAHGKHVLCEKPFALNVQQAIEMNEAAVRARRTAMVGHEFRHAPQRRLVKQLVDEGYVGAVRLCTLELAMDRYVTREPRPLTWAALAADGGGVLGALGSHYIDGLRHWFGEVVAVTGRVQVLRPDVLDARTGSIAQADADDTFQFTLEFAGGATAVMVATFAATPARPTRIVIMGERGTLVTEQPGPNPVEAGIVVGSRDGAPLAPLPMPAEFTRVTDARDPRLAAFRLLVRDFRRGIEEGTSPAPNFADGVACQRVMDAVRASSRQRRTIPLA